MRVTFLQKHPIVFVYLFFLYFSGVCQFLIFSSGTTSAAGLRQALMMSVLWLIPVLIWPARARVITAAVGLVLWAASLVSLGYWLIYGQDFSQSAIFIIFESNFDEGSEFVGSYFRWEYIAALAVYSIIPVLMWRKISPIELPRSLRYKLASLCLVVLSWPFVSGTVGNSWNTEEGRKDLIKGMEPTAPWNLVIGYAKYRTQLAAIHENLKNISSIPPLENLSEEHADTPKTLVLVIGESTNRQRMGLYGYGRDTTPNLSSLRDELLVFDDVITPRPYTIEALQQVLSFATQKDLDAYFSKPTLLNIMKQAGYEVTWITNHQTQSKRNTMLTTLSQLADHQVYLNNNRRQNSYQFDGAVIEPFARALRSAAPKKMIVVHLLGTHRKYTYRYPKSFDRFTTDEGAPEWIGDDILDEYNSYDNAVLYNDYVVSELIKNLDKGTGQQALIYFSDHGEEVYDTRDEPFSGRNEYKPTPAMYTVPFIVWGSREYLAENDAATWQSYVNRSYTISDFIFTWAEVAGLDFDGFDTSRSLLSHNFVERPRWIGDPKDPESIRDFANILPPDQVRITGLSGTSGARRFLSSVNASYERSSRGELQYEAHAPQRSTSHMYSDNLPGGHLNHGTVLPTRYRSTELLSLRDEVREDGGT